jgi:alpha-D-ribose 1-methylphosphonate 5-triphosphate synthase subunit PhnH
LAAEAALGSRFSAVQGANDAFRAGLDGQAGAAAGVAQADQAFTNAKEAYTNASKELAIALNDLSTKNWAVQVNVASDGSSQAFGDVLAGAVSP